MKKQFLDEQSIILDSFQMGVNIFRSGFKPTFIVGLWRGGSTVGIYVQECLQTLGVETDHIAVRTSYQGQPNYMQQLDSPDPRIRVHNMQYLLEVLNADDRLLIVDDVLSTGRNAAAVVSRLNHRLKRNMPGEVKIASLWYRPVDTLKTGGCQPDIWLHETDDWLVFPYEMVGLSDTEIECHKPWIPCAI